MKYQYRFKDESLEQALNVIYGEEYVEDQVNRQMTNTTSYICFDLDHSSTTISKGEIAEIKEYDPDDWNPFPQIKPPAYCHWLVQFESGEIKVIEYVRQEFSSFSVGDFWNAPKLSKVIAFRKLPEPFQPKETK